MCCFQNENNYKRDKKYNPREKTSKLNDLINIILVFAKDEECRFLFT